MAKSNARTLMDFDRFKQVEAKALSDDEKAEILGTTPKKLQLFRCRLRSGQYTGKQALQWARVAKMRARIVAEIEAGHTEIDHLSSIMGCPPHIARIRLWQMGYDKSVLDEYKAITVVMPDPPANAGAEGGQHADR